MSDGLTTRRPNRLCQSRGLVCPLCVLLLFGLPARASGLIRIAAGSAGAGYIGEGDLAISAALNHPTGLAIDNSGTFYIADRDNERIREVNRTGMISTIAGNGMGGYSGDGGPAAKAQLWGPVSVALDSADNLYIVDSLNSRIRKVSRAGMISTVAGNGTDGYSGDGGPATSAQMRDPSGVAIDSSGNLYIADSGNNRVRKVSRAGTISTIAGNGTGGFSGDGSLATSAKLSYPSGVAVDSDGNLYIADSRNNRIRKVDGAGLISTVAGNGTGGYSGDGSAAASASLAYPRGVAVDSGGNLYIADSGNHRIRTVNKAGMIFTVAGDGIGGYSGDGGPATGAGLYYPQGVAFASGDGLLIADYANSRIRRVDGNGMISTIAGNGAAEYSDGGGPAKGPPPLPSASPNLR